MKLNKKRSMRSLKENNQGAAMVMVLCVMVLFFVLCLTMIFSSSVLVGRAKDDRKQKQCQILATSFSKKVNTIMTQKVDYTEKSTLNMENMQDFVRAHIDSLVTAADIKGSGYDSVKWPYYWADASQITLEGGVRNLKDALQKYAISLDTSGSTELSKQGYKMHLELYWMIDPDSDYMTYQLNLTTPNQRYNGIILVVDSVCENGNLSYKVEQKYQLTSIIDSSLLPVDSKWYDCPWTWGEYSKKQEG